MRKADYAHLAATLHKVRRDAAIALAHSTDKETDTVCLTRMQTVDDIARDFARVASIKGPEFLRACGLPI